MQRGGLKKVVDVNRVRGTEQKVRFCLESSADQKKVTAAGRKGAWCTAPGGIMQPEEVAALAPGTGLRLSWRSYINICLSKSKEQGV